MFIKRLTNNVYDVFLGDGWNNWTRIRRNHWGVTVMSGKRLARETIHELNERMIK